MEHELQKLVIGVLMKRAGGRWNDSFYLKELILPKDG
jgi:hypothetical protein